MNMCMMSQLIVAGTITVLEQKSRDEEDRKRRERERRREEDRKEESR